MPNPMPPDIQQKRSFLPNPVSPDVRLKQSFHELVSLLTAEYERLRREHQALQADFLHPQFEVPSTGGVAHGWRVTEPKRLTGSGSSPAGLCWPSTCSQPAGKVVVPMADPRLQMQGLPRPVAGAFERIDKPWEESWRVGRDEGPGTPKVPKSPGARTVLESETRQAEATSSLQPALGSADNETTGVVPTNGYDDKSKSGEVPHDFKMAEETDTDKVGLNGEQDENAVSRVAAEVVLPDGPVRPAAPRQYARPSVMAVLEKESPRISEVGDAGDGVDRTRRFVMKPNAFWWVKTPAFDYSSALLLALNSLMLGLQSHEILSSGNAELPIGYIVLDWFFFAAFVTELICRMMCFGYVTFFCGVNRYWNVFETFLVLIQIFEEVTNVVVTASEENKQLNTGSAVFRILRILRLLRLIRMVRFVRLIRELHAMVVSILSSVRSFFWALVLLFILIYVMSIYVAQSLSELDRATLIAISSEALGDADMLSSLWMINFILFQCMSGGMDWGGFANPLVKEIGWFSGIVFTFFISFTVFVIMNVVTGVFVDASTHSIREEKEKDLLTRLRESFEIADEDHSHTLTWKEFQKNMDHPRMKDYFKAVDLDPSASRNLFSILANEGGTVTLDDLVHGCLRLCGPARAIDQAMTEREHGRMLRALHGTVRNIHDDLAWLSDLQQQVYIARDAQERAQDEQA
eukprot:TRINITY_DN23594_c0_g1_i1.p1 TRINITY_DN23594_c0_g1~~TRINITY_DN23594_c0_g1_i1.p1  ORF type:complete len:691 (+),score=110.23 TRINITY_DN23594_c0_g1_i1:52-2124(+)